MLVRYTRQGPVSVVRTCVSVPVSQVSVLSKHVDELSDATEHLLLMSSQVAWYDDLIKFYFSCL